MAISTDQGPAFLQSRRDTFIRERPLVAADSGHRRYYSLAFGIPFALIGGSVLTVATVSIVISTLSVTAPASLAAATAVGAVALAWISAKVLLASGVTLGYVIANKVAILSLATGVSFVVFVLGVLLVRRGLHAPPAPNALDLFRSYLDTALDEIERLRLAVGEAYSVLGEEPNPETVIGRLINLAQHDQEVAQLSTRLRAAEAACREWEDSMSAFHEALENNSQQMRNVYATQLKLLQEEKDDLVQKLKAYELDAAQRVANEKDRNRHVSPSPLRPSFSSVPPAANASTSVTHTVTTSTAPPHSGIPPAVSASTAATVTTTHP